MYRTFTQLEYVTKLFQDPIPSINNFKKYIEIKTILKYVYLISTSLSELNRKKS